MDCKIMQELKDAERYSRALIERAKELLPQALYAQWALDAQRVQHVHAIDCEACKRAA